MIGPATAGAAVVMPLAMVMTVVFASQDAAAAIDLGPGVPDKYVSAILDAAAACEDAELPPNVLAAQLKAESNFDPDVVSSAGAKGMAQFLPSTWQTWGIDGDGDGEASITNPFDAIASQGKFMCSLLKQFGEIELALAAYNAGPGAVETYGGIPPYPETVDYVKKIMEWAASPDFAVTYSSGGGGSWDGTPVDKMLPAGYRNPRSASDALAWAKAMEGRGQHYNGYCLKFVNDAFGSNSGRYPLAYQVWTNAPERLHHPKDTNPPPGAVVVWSNAGNMGRGAGHIAISVGGGKMLSTGPNGIETMDIASYAPANYYGWMPPKVASGNGG